MSSPILHLIIALISAAFLDVLLPTRPVCGSALPFRGSRSLNNLLHDYHIVHKDSLEMEVRRRAAGANDVRILTVPLPTRLGGGTARLHLRPHQHLFASNLRAVMVGEGGVERPLDIPRHEFWYGGVDGQEGARAQVRLHDNGLVTGSVKFVGGHVISIEPARRHTTDEDPHVIIYTQEDVVAPRNHSHGMYQANFCPGAPSKAVAAARHMNMSNTIPDNTPRARHRRAGLTPDQTTCMLSIVSDYRFYQARGGNGATAAADMVSHIQGADSYIRDEDFGGTTGIGVGIREIIIYDSSASDPYYNGGNTWKVADLLEKFSDADWSASCLAHLFTHQDFDGGVQGLAYVGNPLGGGGICTNFGDSSKAKYYNTGLVSEVNWGAKLLQTTVTLTVLHELGHNFGANHDPSSSGDPNFATCSPSNNLYNMYPSAVDGSASNNDDFSQCSRSSIKNVLDAVGGNCFEPTPAGVCGNTILEADNGEECDAGYAGSSCCDTSCKFIGSAVCEDSNHVCCTNCAADTNKNCFTEFDLDVQCRATTKCGTDPLTCPTPLQKPAGTVCANQGVCTADSDPSLRCKSLCVLFGGTACKCSGEDECRLCCVRNQDGPPACENSNFVWEERTNVDTGQTDTRCFPKASTTWDNTTTTVSSSYPLPATCTPLHETIDTVTWSSYQNSNGESYTKANLILTPGTVCGSGSCDSAGSCQEPHDDFASRIWDFIANLSLDELAKWCRTNLVAATLLFSLPVWGITSCAMCCRDHRKHKKAAAAKAPGGRVSSGATYVHKRERRNSFKMRSTPDADAEEAAMAAAGAARDKKRRERKRHRRQRKNKVGPADTGAVKSHEPRTLSMKSLLRPADDVISALPSTTSVGRLPPIESGEAYTHDRRVSEAALSSL